MLWQCGYYEIFMCSTHLEKQLVIYVYQYLLHVQLLNTGYRLCKSFTLFTWLDAALFYPSLKNQCGNY